MDWKDGPALVTAVVAVLALIGSFVGFLLALRQRGKADEAADRAEAAAERANAARDRTAAALEQIAKAQAPELHVRWGDPRPTGHDHWLVPNIGTAAARNAYISASTGSGWLLEPDLEEPRTIEPQTSIGFVYMRGTVPGEFPTILWTDPDGSDRHHRVVF